MTDWKIKAAVVGIALSLILSATLFVLYVQGQLEVKEAQEKVTRLSKTSSKKGSDSEQVAKLKTVISEKNDLISTLKEDGKETEFVSDEQIETAEAFAKIVVNKTPDREEMKKELSPLATQEVQNQLIPSEENEPTVDNESYEISFDTVESFVNTRDKSDDEKVFTVLLDYSLTDNNLKNVTYTDVSGGVILTEELSDEDTWKVNDFSYFSR